MYTAAEIRNFTGARVTDVIMTDYVSHMDATMMLEFVPTYGKDTFKHRSVKSKAPASSRDYGASIAANNGAITSVTEQLYGVSDSAEFDVRDASAEPESAARISYIDAQLMNAYNNVAEKINHNIICGDNAKVASEPNGLIVRATGGVNDLTPATPIDMSGNAPGKEQFMRLFQKLGNRIGAVPNGGRKVAFMHPDLIAQFKLDLAQLNYKVDASEFNTKYAIVGDTFIIDAGYYNNTHNLEPVGGLTSVLFAKFSDTDVVIPTFYSEVIKEGALVQIDAFKSVIGLDAVVGVAVLEPRSIGIIGKIKIS